MNQKGIVQLFIVLGVVAIIAGFGIYIYPKAKNNPKFELPKIPQIKPSVNDYSNQELGFSFKYANDLSVIKDSEEEFNKRGNGDFRKNFKSYIEYEPGKFLGAMVVLGKSGSYDTNPFTIWVFNNDINLTIDEWYQRYWYYPFVWGDFTPKGKIELAPKDEATISGQISKFGIVDYQPGKPKFVYLSSNKKMYLFRIIGEEGENILQTFTLLKTEENQIYTCPKTGWEDCMPILTPEAQKQCSKEALDWKKDNCPNFKGAAL